MALQLFMYTSYNSAQSNWQHFRLKMTSPCCDLTLEPPIWVSQQLQRADFLPLYPPRLPRIGGESWAGGLVGWWKKPELWSLEILEFLYYNQLYISIHVWSFRFEGPKKWHYFLKKNPGLKKRSLMSTFCRFSDIISQATGKRIFSPVLNQRDSSRSRVKRFAPGAATVWRRGEAHPLWCWRKMVWFSRRWKIWKRLVKQQIITEQKFQCFSIMTRWLCPVIHWKQTAFENFPGAHLPGGNLVSEGHGWLWTPCLSHGMAHFLATKSGWKNAASRQQSAALSWINWRKYMIPSCELQLLSQPQ